MTTRDTSGIQKWSTSVVAPGKRLDYWVGAVCEGFLEMDVTSPRASHFEASLERGQLELIGVNRVLGTSQDVYRTQSAISRSQSNYYYLLCKTDFEFSVVQHDNVSRIQPGDLTLVDFAAALRIPFSGVGQHRVAGTSDLMGRNLGPRTRQAHRQTH